MCHIPLLIPLLFESLLFQLNGEKLQSSERSFSIKKQEQKKLFNFFFYNPIKNNNY